MKTLGQCWMGDAKHFMPLYEQSTTQRYGWLVVDHYSQTWEKICFHLNVLKDEPRYIGALQPIKLQVLNKTINKNISLKVRILWIMANSISSFHSPGAHWSLNSQFSRKWLSWMVSSGNSNQSKPFSYVSGCHYLWIASISDLLTTQLSGLFCKEEAGYCTR